MLSNVLLIGGIILAILLVALAIAIMTWYKKVSQGKALVRTGAGGTKVAFDKGMFVIPVLHLVEEMDLSVKTVEIARMKSEGLICKDNMRADIKVVFFVRVNKEVSGIVTVAQTIGCQRASHLETLRNLFEAKFSEALKTIGKRFDFVELYDSREKFKQEILDIIGTDLNGYVLDDCAIDYLEQTPMEYLDINNILDAEGIKKIVELTAAQKVKANFVRREEEKTLKEQDVEAREAILEYERQLAEKEDRQRREVSNVRAREEAEIAKIAQEERLRAEMARIQTEETLQIAEENRMRQVIVAEKNKQRTEAVEHERVEKDRLLEQTERVRIVTLADIAKERAIEEEKKNIQDVIRDRIAVEKKVVEEEERIKDTRVLAEADRIRQRMIIESQGEAETIVIKTQRQAEAEKLAAEIKAQTLQIEAEAEKLASSKEAEARKIRAEAKAAEEATMGLSEAQVIEAKAKAKEKEGLIAAQVTEVQALAEAKGIEAKAEALRKQGLAEANVLSEKGQVEAQVMEQKFAAEAKGVEQKAQAMRELDGVGREHEEFKLQLEKSKEVELAQLEVDRHIAEAQAKVLAEAMSKANIDIVGGEMHFVNGLLNAIQRGKAVDRVVNSSQNLTEVKQHLLQGGGLLSQIQQLVRDSGLTWADVKDLSLATLLIRLQAQTQGKASAGLVGQLMQRIEQLGIGEQKTEDLL